MALTNEYIQEQLVAKFGEQVYAFSTANGMLSFESAKDLNLKVMQVLYDEPSLGFTFLTDLCAVNYPDNVGGELVVVYHLHNFKENVRIRYSIATAVATPDVFTALSCLPEFGQLQRGKYCQYNQYRSSGEPSRYNKGSYGRTFCCSCSANSHCH